MGIGVVYLLASTKGSETFLQWKHCVTVEDEISERPTLVQSSYRAIQPCFFEMESMNTTLLYLRFDCLKMLYTLLLSAPRHLLNW